LIRCGYQAKGSLEQIKGLYHRCDGLMGLGCGELSLPNQLAYRGITKPIYGHCLTFFPRPSFPAGYVFIGDEALSFQTDIQWIKAFTPDLPGDDVYMHHRTLLIQLLLSN